MEISAFLSEKLTAQYGDEAARIFAGFSEDEKKNFAAYNARLYQNVMSHLK